MKNKQGKYISNNSYYNPNLIWKNTNNEIDFTQN